MIKVDSFSFQGVSGAHSEQAGKNIFPNAVREESLAYCSVID